MRRQFSVTPPGVPGPGSDLRPHLRRVGHLVRTRGRHRRRRASRGPSLAGTIGRSGTRCRRPEMTDSGGAPGATGDVAGPRSPTRRPTSSATVSIKVPIRSGLIEAVRGVHRLSAVRGRHGARHGRRPPVHLLRRPRSRPRGSARRHPEPRRRRGPRRGPGSAPGSRAAFVERVSRRSVGRRRCDSEARSAKPKCSQTHGPASARSGMSRASGGSGDGVDKSSPRRPACV